MRSFEEYYFFLRKIKGLLKRIYPPKAKQNVDILVVLFIIIISTIIIHENYPMEVLPLYYTFLFDYFHITYSFATKVPKVRAYQIVVSLFYQLSRMHLEQKFNNHVPKKFFFISDATQF